MRERRWFFNSDPRSGAAKLEWDSARLKTTNHSEANLYLQRKYRDGWNLARF